MMKGFLSGLGLGVALGMLFAPKRGEELRGELQDRASDAFDRMREAAEPVMDKLRDPQALAEQAREMAGEKLGGVVEMAKRAVMSEDELLNSISREDLLEIAGIGPVTADKLIEGRPYESMDDLAERKIVAPSIIETLKSELRLGGERKSA